MEKAHGQITSDQKIPLVEITFPGGLKLQLELKSRFRGL